MAEQACIISNIVVHKLVKEQHTREASVELRGAPLRVSNTTQRLIDRIHKLYTEKAGKGYGKFEENEDEYPAQKYVRRHVLEQRTTFLELSVSLMEHLQARASRELLATGGYVLIARLTNDERDYLLVAIVTEVIGTAITEGLDVIDSIHLDMSQMRVAGRIDLTGWSEDAERYISFLKGRSDIAEYFKLFLGCNDLMVALEESRKLKEALEQFVGEQEITQEERDTALETAHDYLTALSKEGAEVSLDALANHVWPNDPDALKLSLANEELELSDGFVPDRRAIKGLIKFEGRTTHWKLVFDRKAIRNGSLQYNQETGTITLTNVPDALKADLNDEINDE